MTYELTTATCAVNYWSMPIIVNKKIIPEDYLTAQDVINAGCTAFEVTKLALMSKSRKRELVKARFFIMYVMRLKVKVRSRGGLRIPISLKAIGHLFNRDHTTAIHAIEAVENDLSVTAYRQETNELINAVIKYL